MTVEQLKKIYLASAQKSGSVKWSDLDPSWPGETVKVYSPGTDSGTFDYWKEVMIGKSEESFRSDMSSKTTTFSLPVFQATSLQSVTSALLLLRKQR